MSPLTLLFLFQHSVSRSPKGNEKRTLLASIRLHCKTAPKPKDEASADTLDLAAGSYKANTVGHVNSCFSSLKARSCSEPPQPRSLRTKELAKWFANLCYVRGKFAHLINHAHKPSEVSWGAKWFHPAYLSGSARIPSLLMQ